MQIHELKPKHLSKGRKRVGRGGKKGTYSGKGIKGQAARAGRKMVPIIRELIKRYPKLKGYRRPVMEDAKAVVGIDALEKHFQAGETVTPEELIKKGIIRKIKGKVPEIKILGKGKLSKKLLIEGCRVSKGAQDSIEKAGGAINKS